MSISVFCSWGAFRLAESASRRCAAAWPVRASSTTVAASVSALGGDGVGGGLGVERFLNASSKASLSTLRQVLPDETRIYCGHEYTQKNAEFATSVDPGNAALAERRAAVDAARAKGEPTIPTTMGVEKATNPFLRADEPELAEALGLGGAGPAEVFADLRGRRDVF